jgi:hypothetical protein
MDRLLKRIKHARPDRAQSANWFFLHDNAPSHNETIVKQFLAKKSFIFPYNPPYSLDMAPADYLLFPKVKFVRMGRRFNIILHIQNNVTSELKSIPAAEFYGSIQKLYDHASRCIELGGMYVEG